MRALLLAALLLCTGVLQAETVDELEARLGALRPVNGSFIQEKHLRALPQPLTSTGLFELTPEHGLLWQVRSPLQQDYRIDDSGISRLTPQGWQEQPGRDAAAHQSRLFLSLLRGDRKRLEENFEVIYKGDDSAWQVELLPRSSLMRQVFTRISVEGSEHVERIELFETQGDRTLLRLTSQYR